MSQPRPLVILLLMPSFYGLLSWGFWFVLYLFRLIAWDRPSALTLLVFSGMVTGFLVATIIFFPQYRLVALAHAEMPLVGERLAREIPQSSTKLIAAFHLLSTLGFASYLYYLANAFGGLPALARVLLSTSYRVREVNVTMDPPGLELTYFGWAAIGLTMVAGATRRISRLWYALAAVQFAANLLLIDRTRPITILFTALLVVVPLKIDVIGQRLLLKLVTASCAFVLVFVAIAMWGSKLEESGIYGRTPLPTWLQNIYVYGTGGFAYFNYQLQHQSTMHGLPLEVMCGLYQ